MNDQMERKMEKKIEEINGMENHMDNVRCKWKLDDPVVVGSTKLHTGESNKNNTGEFRISSIPKCRPFSYYSRYIYI